MSIFKTHGIQIAGICSAVPDRVYSVEEHQKRFPNDTVDKVCSSTGIRSIHLGDEYGQTAGDLGYVAADSLLNSLSVDRSKIGVLLFVSYATDYIKPGTSSVLHMRLGLPNDCMATDIGQACAGFVYGHQLMESLMATTDSPYGLLVLGDTGNRLVSREDHTSMMLGDAGSAVLYSRNSEYEDCTALYADGSSYQTIIVPAGGFRDPKAPNEKIKCSDDITRTPYELYMDGLGVLTFSTNTVVDSLREYMQQNELSQDDFDAFVFHQANMFIIQRLIKKLNLNPDKVPVSLDRYGNTSCSSIPLTICDSFGNSETQAPLRILAAGFGIGLAWGITDITVSSDCIFPIIETSNCYKEGIINLEKL